MHLKQLCCLQYPYFVNSYQTSAHPMCLYQAYPVVSVQSDLLYCPKLFHQAGFHQSYHRPVYPAVSARSVYLKHCQNHFCQNHLRSVYLHLALLHLVQLHPVRHLSYCLWLRLPACHCVFLWHFQRHRLQLYQSLRHQFVPHMMHLCRHLYSQL